MSRRDLSTMDCALTRFVTEAFSCSNAIIIREIMGFLGLELPIARWSIVDRLNSVINTQVAKIRCLVLLWTRIDQV